MKTKNPLKNRRRKRRAQRIPDAVAQYHLLDEPNCVDTVMIKNISRSGMCFYSHDQIKIGDSIRAKLYLFGLDDPIIITGEVVWLRKSDYYFQYEIGVKFVVVNRSDYINLSRLIQLSHNAIRKFEEQIQRGKVNIIHLSDPGELF